MGMNMNRMHLWRNKNSCHYRFLWNTMSATHFCFKKHCQPPDKLLGKRKKSAQDTAYLTNHFFPKEKYIFETQIQSTVFPYYKVDVSLL